MRLWNGSPEERGKQRKTPLRMVQAALELDAERELLPHAFTEINQRFLNEVGAAVRILPYT